MAVTDIKRDRMHLRLDARSKQMLERAAAYNATTVSDFVLSEALEAARRTIASRESIVLGPADWAAFHDALLNPPAPNAALKAAARRHAQRRRG
jgi:uncharacterized protein (DUF1778 family)